MDSRRAMLAGVCLVTGCWSVASASGVARNPAALTEPPLSASSSNWYQDAFPWNETAIPSFAARFDTTAILVKSGLDIGPPDGLNSFDVPGDSIVVFVSGGTPPVRVDLVFRILPGPGNYRTVGNATSGLTPIPAAFPLSPGGRPPVTPNVGSSNFWESLLANNGPFGTPGGHAGGVWNPNVWNSARCDTAEANLFPRGVGAPLATRFQSTYHEEELGIGAGDAYTPSTVVRSGLGLERHKCFLATNTALPTDIDCEHDPDGIETPASGTTPGVYDLTWVLATGSGYGADIGVHPYGRQYTIEGTKIIPDGLLTPGAHVEYFWRMAEGGSTALAAMMPDTNVVVPQNGEGNQDGHRWQEFSVLPDRWKEVGRTHPLGLLTGSPACMLVVDAQDGTFGDELAWVSAADTIGITSNQKWGAHNGWHAMGGGRDINVAANNVDRAGRPGFIAEHAGSPGTTWDLYQIKGAGGPRPAGSFGARYAHLDYPNTQINDKRQQGAPTLEHLKGFYKTILWLSGNLSQSVMGPSGDRSSDDQQIIKDWLLSGSSASPFSLNRIFWAMGSGFVESNENEPDFWSQPDLDLNYLGVALQNGAYCVDSGNLKTTITVSGRNDSLYHGEWGLRSPCGHSNDVLGVGLGAVTASSYVWTDYEDPNPADGVTYPAGVYKKWRSTSPWAAITEGYSIVDLATSPRLTPVVDTRGRSVYLGHVLCFLSRNSSCQVVAGTCLSPLDVPNGTLADFVSLANNPLSTGFARIHFGLSNADRVQINVYDVAGRKVRELANRAFNAGEHDVVWDGADDAGRRMVEGVYFVEVRFGGRAIREAKRLVILK
jgi:hypothetical protein